MSPASEAEITRLRRMETYFEQVIHAVDIGRRDDQADGEIARVARAAVLAYREEGAGRWARGFSQRVDVVFDGPPDHEGPRFIEVEDMEGKSLKAGDWIERPNGQWALRLKIVNL